MRHNVANEEDIFRDRQEEVVNYLKEELVSIGLACKTEGIHFSHPFDCFLNSNESSSSGDKDNKPFLPKCKIPWRKITIEDSGGVRIDCKCPNLVGNIMDNSIDEIWNSPMMQRYRSLITAGKVNEICSDVCLNNAVESIFFEGI